MPVEEPPHTVNRSSCSHPPSGMSCAQVTSECIVFATSGTWSERIIYCEATTNGLSYLSGSDLRETHSQQ